MLPFAPLVEDGLPCGLRAACPARRRETGLPGLTPSAIVQLAATQRVQELPAGERPAPSSRVGAFRSSPRHPRTTLLPVGGQTKRPATNRVRRARRTESGKIQLAR